MQAMINWVSGLNDHILWGLPMVVLMLGTGIFLTVVTRAVLFRKFGTVLRNTLLSLFRRHNPTPEAGAVSPFQAVCTALAGTVGTGNIVGVALAISTGGPGAIFWMWISALAGMVIKYSEVTLSLAYRQINSRGEPVGGPMYYIRTGLGRPVMAALFSLFGLVASFGIGAMVQSNSMAVCVQAAFGLPTWVMATVAAALAALVVIGGIRRIAGVAEVLVPLMAGFYILSAGAVLVRNAGQIPAALARIIGDAFTGTAPAGGFLGASAAYACRIGMARGVFTHEAGMGSAPIAHASASTDHPARQGLWGAFEVFFDSIVMCTVTALVILTSGLWCDTPQLPGGAMSSAAFRRAFPGGEYVVTVALTLFAFATIIAWYYYGEKCAEYLFRGNRKLLRIYQLVYIVLVFTGGLAALDVVWTLADLFNGLMAIPNLIALIGLSPVVRRLSEDLFRDPYRRRTDPSEYRRLLTQR